MSKPTAIFYFLFLHLTRLNCLRAYQRKLFQSRNSVRFSTLYSTAWVYTRGTWGFTSLKFAWLAPESSREVVFGSQELFMFWCSRKKNRAVKLYRDTEEYQKIADSINLKSLRFLLQDVSLKMRNTADFTVAGSTCLRMFFWNVTSLFIFSIFFFILRAFDTISPSKYNSYKCSNKYSWSAVPWQLNVHRYAWVCLSLYVSPVINWRPWMQFKWLLGNGWMDGRRYARPPGGNNDIL